MSKIKYVKTPDICKFLPSTLCPASIILFSYLVSLSGPREENFSTGWKKYILGSFIICTIQRKVKLSL
jgi:hypothetical protein